MNYSAEEEHVWVPGLERVQSLQVSSQFVCTTTFETVMNS